tara:strand:+ start:302 stop:469 length:168 start_codon:yes stop_codon:yes gene_type:complete
MLRPAFAGSIGVEAPGVAKILLKEAGEIPGIGGPEKSSDDLPAFGFALGSSSNFP